VGKESRPAAARRVLLVDDQEISRSVAAEMLRQSGIEVTEAAGGAEALTALDDCAPNATYDAVLLDLEMPRMDGGKPFGPSGRVNAGAHCR